MHLELHVLTLSFSEDETNAVHLSSKIYDDINVLLKNIANEAFHFDIIRNFHE